MVRNRRAGARSAVPVLNDDGAVELFPYDDEQPIVVIEEPSMGAFMPQEDEEEDRQVSAFSKLTEFRLKFNRFMLLSFSF